MTIWWHLVCITDCACWPSHFCVLVTFHRLDLITAFTITRPLGHYILGRHNRIGILPLTALIDIRYSWIGVCLEATVSVSPVMLLVVRTWWGLVTCVPTIVCSSIGIIRCVGLRRISLPRPTMCRLLTLDLYLLATLLSWVMLNGWWFEVFVRWIGRIIILTSIRIIVRIVQNNIWWKALYYPFMSESFIRC